MAGFTEERTWRKKPAAAREETLRWLQFCARIDPSTFLYAAAKSFSMREVPVNRLALAGAGWQPGGLAIRLCEEMQIAVAS